MTKKYQHYIVHQVRNTLKYVADEDRNALQQIKNNLQYPNRTTGLRCKRKSNGKMDDAGSQLK